MRAYAKVSPVFWTRGSGKRLRGDGVGQAVAFHLATGPQANMVGLYHVALPTIAHETGHPESEVRAALGRIAAAGFAYYDEEAELAFVPNALEIEVGIGKALKAGDKRRAGILAQVEAVGSHRFVALFWERYGDRYGLGPCPVEGPSMPLTGPSEGPSQPLPSPSEGVDPRSGRVAVQEQEQDQKQEQGQGPSRALTWQSVFAIWAEGYSALTALQPDPRLHQEAAESVLRSARASTSSDLGAIRLVADAAAALWASGWWKEKRRPVPDFAHFARHFTRYAEDARRPSGPAPSADPLERLRDELDAAEGRGDLDEADRLRAEIRRLAKVQQQERRVAS